MKRILRRLAICILAIALTVSSVTAATFSDFADAQDHWAKQYLQKAVEDGVLNGTSLNTMSPNATLSGSQMAAILVRYLGLQHFTKTYPSTTEKDWFYYEAAIAFSAGILPANASVDMNKPVTRSQVFAAFQGAFFSDEPVEEYTPSGALNKFPDADQLSPDAVQAADILVSKGIVVGTDQGMLNPNAEISRAEFVTILYRTEGIGEPVKEAGSKDISDMKILLTANNVPAGGKLTGSATIKGVSGNITCSAAWIADRSVLAGYSNSSKVITDGTTTAASKELVYSLYMEPRHTIGLRLEYKDPETGEVTTIVAEKAVAVANYDRSHYAAELYQEALATISCKWSGGTPDYSTEMKESFVNGKKYSSKTQYLAWVNIATQKVNIFKGSKGNWTLIHTFSCSTGSVAKKHDTPVGVTYVTYKQAVWDFVPGRDPEIPQGYIVRYITRFYPNTGYAFHSILYSRDGSGRIIDGTMSQPASHGCVRTEDVGVKWIYNNLPVNSTVVIY